MAKAFYRGRVPRRERTIVAVAHRGVGDRCAPVGGLPGIASRDLSVCQYLWSMGSRGASGTAARAGAGGLGADLQRRQGLLHLMGGCKEDAERSPRSRTCGPRLGDRCWSSDGAPGSSAETPAPSARCLAPLRTGGQGAGGPVAEFKASEGRRGHRPAAGAGERQRRQAWRAPPDRRPRFLRVLPAGSAVRPVELR